MGGEEKGFYVLLDPNARTSDGGVSPVATEETIGRGIGAAAERGPNAHAVGAAGCNGANQARGAVRAVGTGGQPVALGASIDAITGSLRRAGTHAFTTGTAWPKRGARLPRACVTGASPLGADTGGTLMRKGTLVYDDFDMQGTGVIREIGKYTPHFHTRRNFSGR